MRIELQLALLRDAGVAAGGGIRRDVHLAVLLGLFGRIAGKMPGHGIVRRPLLAHQIERDHGKLRRAAALQKQDLVCVRHGQRSAETRLHILKNIRKGLTSVTHLHHGHAGTAVTQQLLLNLLKHGQRQHGTSSGRTDGPAEKLNVSLRVTEIASRGQNSSHAAHSAWIEKSLTRSAKRVKPNPPQAFDRKRQRF